jgi:hypothetical protein
MKAFWMTLVILISAIFFALAYNYFYFGADFYQKSNFLVLLVLVCLYVLGFFLGRFFPYDTQEVDFMDDEDEEDDNNNLKNIFSQPKPVKKVVTETVDFTDTQDMSGGFKKIIYSYSKESVQKYKIYSIVMEYIHLLNLQDVVLINFKGYSSQGERDLSSVILILGHTKHSLQLIKTGQNLKNIKIFYSEELNN